MIDGSNKPGSLSRMLELVRLSASARAERSATGNAKNTVVPKQLESAPHDIALLKSRLRRQIGIVDLADAAAVAKSRKAMLSEIFVWQFGEAIRNHNEFGAMIDAVEAAISANEGTREKFASVFQELREDGGA